ncbi:MAG: hypothetical protein H6625_00580 [Bdellovibrionaceae bacterium]|nr:hypothetical protein [Pseudobdellovibrionaceae bacterium]
MNLCLQTMLNYLRLLVISLFFIGPFAYGYSYKSVRDLKKANVNSASRASSLSQKISELKQKISEEQDKLSIAQDGLRALNDSSLNSSSELDSNLIFEEQIEFLKKEISQKVPGQFINKNEEANEKLSLQLIYSFKANYAKYYWEKVKGKLVQ